MNLDIRAIFQMRELLYGPLQKERLKTIEIRKEAEWRGILLLFVTFTEKGIRKYQIQGMEKDARSGKWFPRHVGRDPEMKEQNPRLHKQIENWETKGELRENAP